MANGNGTAVNPPPSALIASAFSATPLAPRLTTLSTAHANDESRPTSPSRGVSVSATGTSGTQPPSALLEPHVAEVISADVGVTPRSRGPTTHPRRLLQRGNQPLATQALNVVATHSTGRFSAYLPLHRTANEQSQGKPDSVRSSRSSHDLLASEGSRGHMPPDKLLDARLRQSGSQQVPTFSVMGQFCGDSDFRGDVLVRCASFDFYVHRAVLYFASPFFRAILDGDWQENHPSLYAASTVSATSSSSSDVLSDVGGEPVPCGDPSADSIVTTDRSALDKDDEGGCPQGENIDVDSTTADLEGGLADRLERMATPPLPDEGRQGDDVLARDTRTADAEAEHRAKENVHMRRKGRMNGVTAIIDLSEEQATTFQDVLCHIYPNLDLVVTWLNIFALFSFSDKFAVPFLRRACITFLRASLAGRPIESMALSERHGINDVYRDASRHVLDNMPSWTHDELAVLTGETLLKLERKRTWFLERLLKLGLANPARDYECHSACPDQAHCAKVLHERWHAQYAAAFKYGPPQPSIIWRHLRELDGVGGTWTGTTMSACQASSKAWVQSLFDRMYGLPTHGKATHKFLAIKLEQDDAAATRSRSRLFDSET